MENMQIAEENEGEEDDEREEEVEDVIHTSTSRWTRGDCDMHRYLRSVLVERVQAPQGIAGGRIYRLGALGQNSRWQLQCQQQLGSAAREGAHRGSSCYAWKEQETTEHRV
jgi:hypothetical protein